MSRLLALLIPLLILAGAWVRLSRPMEVAQPTHEQRHMELRLTERRPTILLLGNSPVEKDVDMARLARGLDLNPGRMARLVVPLSRMPVWYAVLNHVVVPHAHTPDLLLVVSTLDAMVERPGAGETEQLWEWMRLLNEPASSGLSQGGSRWSRARGRSSQVRQARMETIKWSALRVAYGSSGVKSADLALDRVFGAEGAKDVGLRTRVLPVVESLPDASVPGFAAVGVKADGQHFLPRFLKAATGAGMRVVFVRVPVSPERPEVDSVNRAVEYWTRDQLHQAGAGWVDLRSLGLGQEHFDGVVHLGAEGRALFTDALVEALRSMDALGEGPMVTHPAPPGLRRAP